VWPYLMIFLPVRLLRPVVLGLIGLAPLYRVVMEVGDPENRLAFVLMIGCLDALGIGALLAYSERSGGDSRWRAGGGWCGGCCGLDCRRGRRWRC
jgi:hypothetical protein